MKKIIITLLFCVSLFGFDLGSVASILPTSSTQQTQEASLQEKLSSKLGISNKQAEGGLGSILNYAKSSLSSDKYATLANAIPGADTLLAKAPNTTQSTGMSSLISQFDSLGLNKDMVMKFVPVIMDYFKSSGSFDAMGILGSLFS